MRSFALSTIITILLLTRVAQEYPTRGFPYETELPIAIDTLALEQHARFLADDLLEGRGPASRGERIAALYLLTQSYGLGLQPLPGQDDYRMPVPLTAVDVHLDQAFVHIFGGDTIRPPDFYHPGGSRQSFHNFQGELLFAGAFSNALSALESHEELTGIVVVLTPPWSGYLEVLTELTKRGAEGIIVLIPDSTFYERLRIVRGPTRYFLPDGVTDPANQNPLPSIVGGPKMIRTLGFEIDSATGGIHARALSPGRRVNVDLPFKTTELTGHNVAAYLPGSDPVLQDEWVIFIAHYDHVGFGEPADGDSIWNGFIDNAVGCAMVLEIASVFSENPAARSVAFLWVTAEEQGLLGSNWFVHKPPIPLERIHAVLNLDGGAPPAPPVSWGLVGADASPAGETARRIIESHGWSVRNVNFGPESDHWPFHLAGVPALMLFPGAELEDLSVEEARELTQRWLKPHTPYDEWHPEFPFAGIGRYANLALEIGWGLANER